MRRPLQHTTATDIVIVIIINDLNINIVAATVAVVADALAAATAAAIVVIVVVGAVVELFHSFAFHVPSHNAQKLRFTPLACPGVRRSLALPHSKRCSYQTLFFFFPHIFIQSTLKI